MEEKDKKLLIAGLLLGGGILLYTKSKNGGTGFQPLDNMINPNLDNPTTIVTDTSSNGGQTVSVNGFVKFGDKGNAVITLQRYLKEIKGESLPLSTRSNGTLDGNFGNEVKTLVTKYNIPYPVPLSKIAEFETALKANNATGGGGFTFSYLDNSGGGFSSASSSSKPYNTAEIGNEIYQSINGFGTNEQRLRKAYTRITTASQFQEVAAYYKSTYFNDMDTSIESDLNDSATDLISYREFKTSLGISSTSKSGQVAPNSSDNGGFFYNDDMWATQGSWGSTNGLNGLGMIDWYNVITKKPTTIYQKGVATSYAKPNTNLGVMIGYSPDKQYVEVIDIKGNQFAVLTSSVGLSAV